MKLGSLFETGIDVANVREQPTYVSFHHKSLQEFAAAYYIHQSFKTQDVKV